jgi:hypothetical protein
MWPDDLPSLGRNLRDEANVKGPIHDLLHRTIIKLAERGASDSTIMAISRARRAPFWNGKPHSEGGRNGNLWKRGA